MAGARSSFELALSAASAHSAEQRAWALVELAASLRREERWQEALGVLDHVVEQKPSPEAELAAYTCAIAVHCDLKDYETARVVGEYARGRAVSPYLMRALGRMYYRLFEETGDEALSSEAHDCFSLADAWEQVG